MSVEGAGLEHQIIADYIDYHPHRLEWLLREAREFLNKNKNFLRPVMAALAEAYNQGFMDSKDGLASTKTCPCGNPNCNRQGEPR